jgi:hypothetical protein
MSTSCCILLDHDHNGDQLIPSFVNSFRLVLHDLEHVTLHTPRSGPHWRSTHPYLSRFDSLSLQDYEHITLRTPLSCPYWKSTHHTFLRRFNSLGTTRRWVCHVANSSIMPTFKINTSFPSYYKIYERAMLHTPPSCPHWRSKHHSFLRRFDSLSTTRLWARYVVYFSIMPTLEVNTSLPS